MSSQSFKNVAEVIEMDLRNQPTKKVSDIEIMQRKIQPAVKQQLKKLLTKYGSYKVIFNLEYIMHKQTDYDVDDEGNIFYKDHLLAFNSGSVKQRTGQLILNERDISKSYNQGFEVIKNEIDEFIKNGSDWFFGKCTRLFIKVTKYSPFVGSSYIDLPDWVKNKKCVINIKNDDDKCFKYSVLCALHINEIKSHPERISHYAKYDEELNFEGINFPVSLDDINKFEKLNQLPINVFQINENFDENDDTSQRFTLMYSHTIKNEKSTINLLFIENEEKAHYCFI
jgi:hypothetical protein